MQKLRMWLKSMLGLVLPPDAGGPCVQLIRVRPRQPAEGIARPGLYPKTVRNRKVSSAVCKEGYPEVRSAGSPAHVHIWGTVVDMFVARKSHLAQLPQCATIGP